MEFQSTHPSRKQQEPTSHTVHELFLDTIYTIFPLVPGSETYAAGTDTLQFNPTPNTEMVNLQILTKARLLKEQRTIQAFAMVQLHNLARSKLNCT